MGEDDRALARAAAIALCACAAAIGSARAEPTAALAQAETPPAPPMVAHDRPDAAGTFAEEPARAAAPVAPEGADGASPRAAPPADSAPVDITALADRLQRLFAAGVEPSSAHGAALALGADGERALIALFERTEAPRYVRLRALGALLDFESGSSVRYFERLVAAASAPKDDWLGALHPARSPLVLRRALAGLRQGVAASAPQPALEPVARCMAHPDAHVRRAATEVLAVLQDRRSSEVLSKRLTSERSRMVRAHLERAITARSTLRSAR